MPRTKNCILPLVTTNLP